jgi:site-specific DNA recombinase
MDNTTRRFFLYTRKSTDDAKRQVRSIHDQLAEAREHALREGIVIVDTFVEKQTAKKPGRPIFNEMLDRIERGEATGIVAWHPDRLARNSLDGGRIIWLIDEAKITELLFPSGYRFEPTPQGKLTLAIEFGISKYYVDKLSADIQRGHRQKLKDGIWPGFAPLGYMNDRTSRTIVTDPVRGPLVRKAFELYAAGDYTLDRIREAMTAHGLTSRENVPLSRNQYHRLFQNPIYYGVIRYCKEHYEGRHQPLVTKELFELVQEAMRRKSKPKTPILKPYMYRGLFHCGECGRLITTERQKGHNYLRCTKWHVTCSQRYIREDRIAEHITDALRYVALPPESVDWMINEAVGVRMKETQASATYVERIRSQSKETDEQLDRLLKAYVERVLSLDEYREAKKKLVDEKRRLEDELITIERNRSNTFEPVVAFLNEVTQAGNLAERGTDEQKRDFFKKVASNPNVFNRELRWEPRGAWKLVAGQGSFAQHNVAPAIASATFLGENHHDLLKRRRRDSNPRDPCGPTGFQDRRNQPLCHSSNWIGERFVLYPAEIGKMGDAIRNRPRGQFARNWRNLKIKKGPRPHPRSKPGTLVVLP